MWCYLSKYGQQIMAVALLMVCLPILLIAMCLIWMDSEGQVIFRQKRVGKGQKLFTIYKLRTMTSHASPQKDALFADKKEFVTPLGRLLRIMKIDELPQLINVIKGDMNLIGPRPLRVKLHNYYAVHVKDFLMRYQVAPGIVGLSQLVDAKDEDRNRGILLDLYYIRNRSLKLDIQILCCTVIYLFHNVIEAMFAGMKSYWLDLVFERGIAGRAGRKASGELQSLESKT